jgi:hypothetical protein
MTPPFWYEATTDALPAAPLVGAQPAGRLRRKHTRASPQPLRPSGRMPRMESDPNQGLLTRVLQFLGLRKRPPDSAVREPRRPVPSASGGAVTLEPPDADE